MLQQNWVTFYPRPIRLRKTDEVVLLATDAQKPTKAGFLSCYSSTSVLCCDIFTLLSILAFLTKLPYHSLLSAEIMRSCDIYLPIYPLNLALILLFPSDPVVDSAARYHIRDSLSRRQCFVPIVLS